MIAYQRQAGGWKAAVSSSTSHWQIFLGKASQLKSCCRPAGPAARLPARPPACCWTAIMRL